MNREINNSIYNNSSHIDNANKNNSKLAYREDEASPAATKQKSCKLR